MLGQRGSSHPASTFPVLSPQSPTSDCACHSSSHSETMSTGREPGAEYGPNLPRMCWRRSQKKHCPICIRDIQLRPPTPATPTQCQLQSILNSPLQPTPSSLVWPAHPLLPLTVRHLEPWFHYWEEAWRISNGWSSLLRASSPIRMGPGHCHHLPRFHNNKADLYSTSVSWVWRREYNTQGLSDTPKKKSLIRTVWSRSILP